MIDLWADAGYDTRQIFEHNRELGIVSLIRIKKNVNSRADVVGRMRGLTT